MYFLNYQNSVWEQSRGELCAAKISNSISVATLLLQEKVSRCENLCVTNVTLNSSAEINVSSAKSNRFFWNPTFCLHACVICDYLACILPPNKLPETKEDYFLFFLKVLTHLKQSWSFRDTWPLWTMRNKLRSLKTLWYGVHFGKVLICLFLEQGAHSWKDLFGDFQKETNQSVSNLLCVTESMWNQVFFMYSWQSHRLLFLFHDQTLFMTE